MSERTGLGVVEVAILEAFESSRFVRCDRALASVEERIGLAPGYAYEVLADLARPWTMPVGLVHGQGNFGSRGDDPPAGSRYTEARISPAGRVALAAERGQIAAVPIGVINGNTYRGGLRPPFRPDAIIAAAREVIRRPEVTRKELADIACQLHFLTGCTVSGDLAALAAGRQVELRLQAQVSISGDRAVVIIESIPPNISIDETARIIASRASVPRWADDHPGLRRITGLPLADLRDETTDRTSPFGRLICIPKRGTDPEQLQDMLLEIRGVYTTMPVKLSRPLSRLIREWVQVSAREDVLASLTALEQATNGKRS